MVICDPARGMIVDREAGTPAHRHEGRAGWSRILARPSPRGAYTRRSPAGLLRIAVLALTLPVLLGVAPAWGDTHSDVLVDRGVAVYYAVVPAEMIRGHLRQHPEATMHGGIPGRPHAHHVLIALFDAESFERITDAEVTATVSEIGLAGQTKRLEPFTVAEALTYGNYFEFRPRTHYRVRIDVKRPGAEGASRVEFEFKH